jgi:hypothetical protein
MAGYAKRLRYEFLRDSLIGSHPASMTRDWAWDYLECRRDMLESGDGFARLHRVLRLVLNKGCLG